MNRHTAQRREPATRRDNPDGRGARSRTHLAESRQHARPVVLENGDAVQVIDTANHTVIKTIKSGQMGQALVYVANAVPSATVLT